jgi:drug/metabolite transporter (DMT)-like permease
MAVVAPTTAVCAVAIPVLVAMLLGERPGALGVGGILLGILSIVLVSQQSDATADSGTAPPPGAFGLPPGVAMALVSGVAIGLFFLSLAQTGTEAGMWPILAARLTSVTLFAAGAVALRIPFRLPRPALALALGGGIIDMLANAAYLLAARTGPLSLVVTLSSLYPASTVLLARVVLGERLNARQVGGVLCALAAIVLIVKGG